MELTIMQGSESIEGNKAVIILAGGVTVSEVDELKAALFSAMAATGELLLDVGAITATDPALLQLILSTRLTAERAGKKFELSGFSAALDKTAGAAGFIPEDDGKNKGAHALWKEQRNA
jgi:anti-anti-sigma regulatory factor